MIVDVWLMFIRTKLHNKSAQITTNYNKYNRQRPQNTKLYQESLQITTHDHIPICYLITRRSQVQILPPQPCETLGRVGPEGFLIVWGSVKIGGVDVY